MGRPGVPGALRGPLGSRNAIPGSRPRRERQPGPSEAQAPAMHGRGRVPSTHVLEVGELIKPVQLDRFEHLPRKREVPVRVRAWALPIRPGDGPVVAAVAQRRSFRQEIHPLRGSTVALESVPQGPLAHLVERRFCKAEAVGSNPTRSTDGNRLSRTAHLVRAQMQVSNPVSLPSCSRSPTGRGTVLRRPTVGVRISPWTRIDAEVGHVGEPPGLGPGVGGFDSRSRYVRPGPYGETGSRA